MTDIINSVIDKMIEYYSGDPKRVQHFIKVYTFASLIGRGESIDDYTQNVLEAAAAVHDIGIKVSEQKYGSSAGRYQELEGPPIARKLLSDLGIDEDVIERVCYLVGHHHTYDGIDGMDYQILVEADFIVNAYEDELFSDAVRTFYGKIFKTKTGKRYLEEMYDI